MARRRKPRLPAPRPDAVVPPRRPTEPAAPHHPTLASEIIALIESALKHHFLLGLAAIGAIVVAFGLFMVTRSASDCIMLKSEHLGEVSTCEGRTAAEPNHAGPPEEHLYTDPRNGFGLRLDHPDDWSVIPTEDFDDGSGQPGKSLKIPPGLLVGTGQDVTILTNDAAVAFFGRKGSGAGIASLWIYRIPGRTGPVDDLIKEEIGESGQYRRTGSVTLPFAISRGLGRKPLDPNGGHGGGSDRVTPDNVAIAPDHRSALLHWVSPYVGVDMDIVGRFVVGPHDTFYVVALTPKPTDDAGRAVNEQLRAMIESFRAL